MLQNDQKIQPKHKFSKKKQIDQVNEAGNEILNNNNKLNNINNFISPNTNIFSNEYIQKSEPLKDSEEPFVEFNPEVNIFTEVNDLISDEFIEYSDLNDKIIEQEEEIISTHMQIIRDDAKMLTEEGELITNIKGVGEVDTNFNMEDYMMSLDGIINKKILLYMNLKKKMEVYKQTLTEGNKLKNKLDSNIFI